MLMFAEQEHFIDDDPRKIYDAVHKAHKLFTKYGADMYAVATVNARDKTTTTFRKAQTVMSHIKQEILTLSKKSDASR